MIVSQDEVDALLTAIAEREAPIREQIDKEFRVKKELTLEQTKALKIKTEQDILQICRTLKRQPN
jgi:flagellar motor switch protein FliM